MRQWIIYLMFISLSASGAVVNQSSSRLTLEQVIINVLEHSPQIKAADYEAKAVASRIRSAQQSTPYRATIELENFAGSGRNAGSDNLESTLSLSKVLELGNKARYRGEVARNKVVLLQNEQDAKRLDLLADATRNFIQLVTDQERLEIATDSLSLARHTQDLVALRVKAGKSPKAELRRANITVARNKLKLENLEYVLASSRMKLTTLWGETRTQFSSAEADLFAIDEPAPFESLVLLLEDNPDLVRYANEKRLSETRIQLARSKKNADIEISGGIRHFNSTDDNALLMSLSIPFGSASRAAPDIDEAELSGQRDTYVYEKHYLNLYATLFEIYQNITHSVETVQTLRKTIIPQAQSVLNDYETGYTAGRYSFLELTEAQRALLDSRLEAVIAAADYHRYRIEIDRLTGAGLSTGVSQ
jgi:outer membrane protein, heavy metal efflux system